MINEGTHDYGRQRTAYDRLVMDGLAPHVIGGNPTPGEAEAQRAQDRQATIPTLGDRHDYSVHPGDHVIEYERRGMFCHTCGKWIEWPAPQSYALMPAKLAARGESGWEFDADRDSEKAARLAALVKDMDVTCEEIMSRDPNGNLELRALARRWQAIRRITQGGQ